uniref:C-type lectin domain-containing protein n=1 Tax=Nannospalax galili TaxID=1026970 RepID=A0A8C6RLG2_NANGA
MSQNKYIANKQEITYADIKLSKSQQKQRIVKAEQSPAIESEEQVNYVELKFHRTSHVQHRKWLGGRRERMPQTTAWRVVTGILGVLCMVLMTTVGILLPKLFSSQEDQSREYSHTPPLCPADNEPSCDLCSRDWIATGNSYYHGFNKTKTWAESQAECAELDSHLLKIDTEEELENLSLFGIKGWIHLKMNETDGFWLWENGSKIQSISQNNSLRKNCSCPYMRGNHIYAENCSSRKQYTCEFNI